jgi:hypothetical protein
MSRKAWIIATVGAVFIAGSAASFLNSPGELALYVNAGSRMAHGEPIYRNDERAFSYPPLFALPFTAMSRLPEPVQRPLWFAISLTALVIIVYRLHRRLVPMLPARKRPPLWLFWLLVALLSGRHIISVFESRSHDLLIFLCVFLAIDAGCSAKDGLAGLLAGVGAALKATPLLFAPLFLWQRRFVAVVCLAAALTAGMFLPDLLCPAKDGVSWSVSWYDTFIRGVRPGQAPDAAGAWKAWNPYNQSLSGTLCRLFSEKPPSMAQEPDVAIAILRPNALKHTTIAAELAIVAWLGWVTRRRLTTALSDSARSIQRLGEGAALICAMVLLSPMSSKTHFCVLLVPIAFCLADFLYRRRDPLVGTSLVLAFVLGTVTVKGLIRGQVGQLLISYGSVTACALIMLMATGRVLLQRERAEHQIRGVDEPITEPKLAA